MDEGAQIMIMSVICSWDWSWNYNYNYRFWGGNWKGNQEEGKRDGLFWGWKMSGRWKRGVIVIVIEIEIEILLYHIVSNVS